MSLLYDVSNISDWYIINDISTATANKHITLRVFISLSNTFDIVNHGRRMLWNSRGISVHAFEFS